MPSGKPMGRCFAAVAHEQALLFEYLLEAMMEPPLALRSGFVVCRKGAGRESGWHRYVSVKEAPQFSRRPPALEAVGKREDTLTILHEAMVGQSCRAQKVLLNSSR